MPFLRVSELLPKPMCRLDVNGVSPSAPCAPLHLLVVVVTVWLATLIGCTKSEDGSAPVKFRTPGVASDIGVSSSSSQSVLSAKNPGAEIQIHAPLFKSVESELGISFRYDNGASPKRLMVEATGGGAAWLDVDQDGWIDLWCVQGGNPQTTAIAQNLLDQVFRNHLGTRFTDVTANIALDTRTYSQGVAVGDFNGDGFDDVYVTNVGPDQLFENQGDGTFLDVTASAGTLSRLWGSSAAFADLDVDGDLDLYVCNYVDYDPNVPPACFGDNGKPGICHPRDVDPLPNKLFINSGDGTFQESLVERGMDALDSKSLGVVVADFNADGLPDVFVANDTTANHLFVNQGNAHFVEEGMAAGCAASGMGQFQASMGVAFGDYDQDLRADLYCTHFTADSNTLYRGLPGGSFDDVTRRTDLHLTTMDDLGFGTIMSDFNADGRMELMTANGHIDSAYKAEGDRYEMEARLFTYVQEENRWKDVAADAGEHFRRRCVSRAVASCDYDRDGDLDLAIVHQDQPTTILRNDSISAGGLLLRFTGRDANRRGIGVVVEVHQKDSVWRQQLAGGTSYCASHEPVLHFGLGDDSSPCQLKVTWPSETISEIDEVKPGTSLWIREERR